MQREFQLLVFDKSFRLSLLILLISCIAKILPGQEIQEYIISYKQGHQPLKTAFHENEQILSISPIFKDLNLWVVKIKKDKRLKSTLKFIEKDPNIRYLHESAIATNRQVPNDPDYPSQWSLPLIDMEETWDITTGGKNAAGHDIVVAILDDGYQIDHPDLVGAIWSNEGEIEDNGIDDDNNGFVDDKFGWNALALNDDHLISNHGTSVAGIIGATTNNDNQIAGINWDVKLMLTSSGSQNGYSLPLIVKSYEYIYEQRKIYNETQGAAGAYVVATNYSGGIEDRFPEDFPSWCEVYDALGSVGVINIGSTSNNDKNVDVDGDLPSTCPSDFLIVTTNSGRTNAKVINAGYGMTSVDLAAPGDNIYTISRNSGIDQTFFGTSGSAPHVAGVVSLMYAVLCEESYQQSLDDPASMALTMRTGILSQVKTFAALDDLMVTGGVLNALNSVASIDETLGDCCSIDIVGIEATEESCADANDALIIIEASGEDLTGNLSYVLTQNESTIESELGSFDRLPPGTYALRVEDAMNALCFSDTTVNLNMATEVCPFGEFAILGLRNDAIGGRLIIDYDLDEQKTIRVQIHDSVGRLAYSQEVVPSFMQGRSHEVYTGDFPAGIYHASILANGFRDVASFLVVH